MNSANSSLGHHTIGGPNPVPLGAHPAAAPATPEQTLTRWATSLQRLLLPEQPLLRKALEELSLGVVSQEMSARMPRLFDLLIELEEFDLFVELFTAHDQFLARQSADSVGGAPHRSVVRFALPSDWTPTHTSLDKMVETFARIRVQDVEVMSKSRDNIAPSAVSHCLVALLMGTVLPAATGGSMGLRQPNGCLRPMGPRASSRPPSSSWTLRRFSMSAPARRLPWLSPRSPMWPTPC